MLNEIIAENNENSKKHEKEASADDPLVINELKIGEEGEGDFGLFQHPDAERA